MWIFFFSQCKSAIISNTSWDTANGCSFQTEWVCLLTLYHFHKHFLKQKKRYLILLTEYTYKAGRGCHFYCSLHHFITLITLSMERIWYFIMNKSLVLSKQGAFLFVYATQVNWQKKKLLDNLFLFVLIPHISIIYPLLYTVTGVCLKCSEVTNNRIFTVTICLYLPNSLVVMFQDE